jgi:hypothetical protein
MWVRFWVFNRTRPPQHRQPGLEARVLPRNRKVREAQPRRADLEAEPDALSFKVTAVWESSKP